VAIRREGVDDQVAARIAKNNVAFREANDKIRDRANEYSPDMERIPFLCECPRTDCVEIVRLTLDEYGELRSDSSLFMTAVGHETAEEPLGEVVSRLEGYVIVAKDVSGL
jgi:hypothetical protein